MLPSMRFERVHFLILSTAVALFLILTFVKYNLIPSADSTSSTSPSIRKPGTPLNIDERMARSEKAWQKSVQDRMRTRSDTPPGVSWEFWNTQGVAWGLTIWDFFTPAYACPWDIQRVGRFGDGGKWICGMSKYVEEEEKTLLIYSFGVSVDSTFEEEMLSRTNVEVVAVDYSVDSFGEQLSAAHFNRSTFLKVGLSGNDEPNTRPPFYTLKTLMEKHNHSYIDVLKVDVEGAEFVAITKFMDDFADGDLPVGQLSMELHLEDVEHWDFIRVSNFLERLESFGMRITAMEPNWGSTVGGPPRFIEYVWVNVRDKKSVLWRE